MEIQQTAQYLKYVRVLGWKIHKVDGVAVITKHFPILGGLAKIQRPAKLPSLTKLIPLLKSEKIKTVAPEPDATVDELKFRKWCRQLGKNFKINKSSYLPTKTIRIDLKPDETDIFKRFTEAKQRGVRRAIKHGVLVKEAQDINDLIKIKNKSAGLLGFITTYGIKELWPIMGPKHASILLAYHSHDLANPPDFLQETKQSDGLLSSRPEFILSLSEGSRNPSSIKTWIPGQARNGRVVGGILLLFMDRLAYYWIAGATPEGKKLFSPTLLVWEALKLAKTRGCREFDFVGVWDERQPQYFKAWHGFTKFKEGFGGTNLYYPLYK